jgi:DNA polymerase-4
VIVGGSGDRGVVAAASYEARAYGIHSAMPSTRARRLCPHAVFLPGDHEHYSEVSRKVMALFHDVTPLVEPLSLDEAFLDVRGALHGGDHAPAIAEKLRARVAAEESLTCSVGVATNKFLAKLATERAKPRASVDGPVFGPGVHVVDAGAELDFLHPLPVGDLWGVGPATGARLSRMGIETVADLAAQPERRVTAVLGVGVGGHLHRLARGIDTRPVVVDHSVKSIGHEETFPRDLVTHEELGPELVRLADAVSSRLRGAGVVGRTVTIKVRFGDFTTITRSITLPEPIDGSRTITIEADRMLRRIDPTPGIRLLGVSCSQLTSGAVRQLSLDDVAGPAWGEADQVIDEIRERFGSRAIGPAAIAGPDGGIRRKEKGDQQWGPDVAPAAIPLDDGDPPVGRES